MTERATAETPTNFYRQRWDKPYLTPSIAVDLLTKSPRHARMACPYFDEFKPSSSPAMDEGSIVDMIVLGGKMEIAILECATINTNALRAQRDEAVAAGCFVLKRADYDRVVSTATAVLRAIREEKWLDLLKGKIKERLFWESGGVECSTEPDINRGLAVIDLKRTKVVPTADRWQRHANRMFYHIQAAAHLEATGAEEFAWLVVESEPPHSVVIHTASPAFIKVGQRDWDAAKMMWANCLACNKFPGPEGGIIEPESWQLGNDDDLTFTE